jgi:2-polyprenyl-6-methoxyphenol hydroxylase-like FAD-dependent oxidoreductase
MAGIRGNHAVVLGASMAGLLAARVLADAYERVTVVERDLLLPDFAPRRGVPQGRHVHALLARGGVVLDRLFPGFTVDAVDAGVPVADLLGECRWLFSGFKLKQSDIGQPVLLCGRPLLEGLVRGRVRALGTVAIRDGHDVAGLLTTADRRRIAGVRVRADGGAEEAVEADLVLDATGRGSRTPLWLEQLGFPKPFAERIEVGVGYTSRPYRLADGALGKDKLILHGWDPGFPRGAAVAVQEDGRALLTATGILGDRPPTDPRALDEFLAGLRFPDITEALEGAEPLGDPVPFQYPANVRRRYERLRDFPDGLLVLGDALCAFDPVYGQGMTSAAMQAEALRDLLAEDAPLTWRRYFRAVAGAVEAPWRISSGSDLAFPGVVGRRTPAVRLVNAYLPRLHAAASTDPALAAAFVRVTGLLDEPRSLLRPGVVAKVLTAKRARPVR